MTPTLAYLEFTSHPQLKLILMAVATILGASGLCWKCGRLGFIVDWLSRRPRLCGTLIFIFAFAVVSLLATRRGIPGAYVHDEFSYLLAADTFAHGRLTNPTPPAWEHFETMHVLVKPSYQSKYPPGQGLFMAMGQVLFNQPIVGVWLSTALAALALWWAVRAYVSPKWALLGGLLACVHPQILEWGQRYWGGNVALLAGALLTGAAARLAKKPTPQLGAVAGLGVFLLAITRPFEGMVLTLLLGAAAIVSWVKTKPQKQALITSLAGFCVVFLPGMAWLGYYNHRLTGSALRLPYAEHHAQYGSAPLFIFQPLRPMEDWPSYNNPQLLQFAKDSNYDHLRKESWSRMLERACYDLDGMQMTFFGNIAGLAGVLLILPLALLSDRKLQWTSAILLVFAAVLLLETYMFGHYVAPAGALMLALTLRCARWMWKSGGLAGKLILRAGLATVAVGCLFWWIGFHGWIVKPDNWREIKEPWYAWKDWIKDDFLGKKEGKHLVIVRYAPDHFVHNEWVYNGADLQNAKVIFARDLGPEKNKSLLNAFKDRTPWIIEPDNMIENAPNPTPVYINPNK